MEMAVKIAAEISKPGDIVLLSPACASFDMYEDYKARGNAFIAEVNNLTG
jgi:UDP-N-acetylmuramoylalanine--D-glutamate ligase